METETRTVVETTVVPSDTNLKNPTSATHDWSEPTHAQEIDETQDWEFCHMETKVPDPMTAVLEPPPVSKTVPPSQLPQH